jgi:hypothetical protein
MSRRELVSYRKDYHVKILKILHHLGHLKQNHSSLKYSHY